MKEKKNQKESKSKKKALKEEIKMKEKKNINCLFLVFGCFFFLF